jgi:hypothetical protein
MMRRILVIALVTTGTMALIPGAALALSGPSDRGSAAQVVYPTTTTPTTGTPPAPSGQVLGDTAPETPPNVTPETQLPPEVLPDATQTPDESAPETEGAVAESRPVVLDAEEGERVLPFTGFLAIPVLMLAAAMLVVGLLLRRYGGSRAPASA